jgi:hypothetical protein
VYHIYAFFYPRQGMCKLCMTRNFIPENGKSDTGSTILHTFFVTSFRTGLFSAGTL